RSENPATSRTRMRTTLKEKDPEAEKEQDTPWTECQPIAGHTHNLEMPINLSRMFLDRVRKPEYPEETPEAR
ncbi:hypothetical protein QTP86_031918, partial [Hemibagrus guttatus]